MSSNPLAMTVHWIPRNPTSNFCTKLDLVFAWSRARRLGVRAQEGPKNRKAGTVSFPHRRQLWSPSTICIYIEIRSRFSGR